MIRETDTFYREFFLPLVRRAIWRHGLSAEPLRDILSFEKAASGGSRELANRIVAIAFRPVDDIKSFFTALDFAHPDTLGAVLLSVKELGLEIARDPIRLSAFTSLLISRLAAESLTSGRKATRDATNWKYLRAWTHRLAGMSRLHAGDFAGAGPHLRTAYRLLAEASGSPFDFSSVEIVESQRRTFTGRAKAGLALAERAECTYVFLAQDAYVARAKVARGMALGVLGRYEAAVALCLQAAPEFEKQHLWSNYIGAVNSLGLALTRLGRVDEARSAYAKVLRKLSREKHSSWIPLVKHGLAELLLASGRYGEAAHSFRDARNAIHDLPFGHWHLKWGLQEVEAWARTGETDLANELLQELLEEARRQGVDAKTVARLKGALSRRKPNFVFLAKLRKQMVRGILDRRPDLPHQRRRDSQVMQIRPKESALAELQCRFHCDSVSVHYCDY